MAPGDVYYLDCGFGNKFGNDGWCDPFKTWLHIYRFEPSDYMNDGSILGSEVAVWSEIMDDSNVHVKVWPRGAAMSDKMWGQKTPLDLAAVVKRLNAFGEYLNDRGIPTSPITGRWCEPFTD